MSGPARLIFLRHGRTAWNAEGRTMGRSDPGLDRTGIRQALAARAALISLGVTSVWCSPLRRCRQTVRLALGAPASAPVRVLPGLMERGWGEWEGRPAAGRPDRPAGAEPPDAFEARVAEALARITDHDTPLVIAHSGVWRALMRIHGRAPPARTIAHARPLPFERAPRQGIGPP